MALKKNFARGLVALGVVGALASTAHAERRTALGGNLLIEDNDDVFLFPQNTKKYKNNIWLDYGATAGAGNAVLTLGDEEFTYGIALHRGDVKGPFLTNSLTPDPDGRSLGIIDRDRLGGAGAAGPANGSFASFGGPFTIDSATFVDLFASFGDLGVRATIGRAVNSTTNGAGDDTGEHDTFLGAQFGWGHGTRGVDTRLDISGALNLDIAGSVAGGVDLASGTAIGLSGLLRGYSPIDSTLDLGYLASLNIGSTSVSDNTAPNDASTSRLAINAGGGVGPAFTFGQTQLAAYGTLRIGYQGDDPNSEVDNDDTTTLRVVLPGVQLATEIALTDWLRIRTGAEYSWQLEDVSGPGNNAGAGTQDGVFAWNAGFGIYVDQFRFDGALQHGFVTGGPDFIGGSPNGAGFLAVASMTYSFDAARQAATPVGEPAPEAAPAAVEPEPALAPAPAPAEPAPAPAEPAAPAPVNPEAGATGSVGGSISIGQ